MLKTTVIHTTIPVMPFVVMLSVVKLDLYGIVQGFVQTGCRHLPEGLLFGNRKIQMDFLFCDKLCPISDVYIFRPKNVRAFQKRSMMEP